MPCNRRKPVFIRSRWLAAQVLLATAISAGTGAPGRAQERVVVGHKSSSRVSLVAAVSKQESGILSGLFAADRSTGWISYRSSFQDGGDRIQFTDFEKIYRFFEPAALAFADPLLYVYDARTRRLWTINIREPVAQRESQTFSLRMEHPSHLAVSPEGLVAVLEGNRVVFLQEGSNSVVYARSVFPAPIDMAFSAWDTLHVLDGRRNALVTITFSQLDGGGIAFESETELPVPQNEEGQMWEAMGVFEGQIYLADQNRVYAYLEADNRLVPVATKRPGHEASTEIDLTQESLYLVDGLHVDVYPRAQPVDIALEGSPQEGQRALLAVYRYLAERQLLKSSEILARRSYERLEELLLERGTLWVPLSGEPPKTEEASARESGWPWRQKAKAPVRAAGPSEEEKDFLALLCDLNPELCRSAAAANPEVPWSLAMPVPRGERLVLPSVEVASDLRRERILLEGQPLWWHVENRVLSPQLREQIDADLLGRLNPGWESADFSELRQGAATVPVEHWTVMIAAPAAEVDDKSSELWALPRRYPSVGIYGRTVFTRQRGRSGPVQPDDADRTDLCELLRRQHRRWLDAVGYPVDPETGRLLHPVLRRKPVRLGILEYESTVKRNHEIFSLDRDHPTWHQAVNLDLVAKPDPASFEAEEQVVQDVTTFSVGAHHGTHVAALVAGREGKCWSGLLPRARLVLVDLDDTSRLRRSVLNALSAEVSVFNVSQDFPGTQEDLYKLVLELEDRAVFVGAAGNSGEDLNDNEEASVPAPARWDVSPNVISVTAGDWNGNLIPTTVTAEGRRTGANHGKRYVDLLAPGQQIYSASEPPGKYGPATGTSQAAPQVAAAAALLMDYSGARMSPADAKARLIATADWSPDYENKVWGGRLNFGNAVSFPERSLLRTTTGEDLGRLLYSVELANDPDILITNAPVYYERSPNEEGEIAPERIRFSRILSLEKQPDGSFRVVLRKPGTDELKILLNARLEDAKRGLLPGTTRIKCETFEVYDPEEERFKPDGGCAGGLSIQQIEEYFLGGDYRIR